MASGHVNRTNRPNTWLHRPNLRREDSPCQPGAVHTWPFATVRGSEAFVWNLRKSVAKLFWAPERAIMVQDHLPVCNVDSKICLLGFNYCERAVPRGVLQHNLRHSGHRQPNADHHMGDRNRYRPNALSPVDLDARGQRRKMGQ